MPICVLKFHSNVVQFIFGKRYLRIQPLRFQIKDLTPSLTKIKALRERQIKINLFMLLFELESVL